MKSTLGSLSPKQRRALTEKLDAMAEGLGRWSERVRPADGTRGRFRWAVESTRPANVGATRYVVSGLENAGVLGRFWTAADRRAGAEWIRSMNAGHEQYRDPALFGSRGASGDDAPGPEVGAVPASVNQYARIVLARCVDEPSELPPEEPPPDWPQAGDDPAEMLAWIKSRPYDTRPWGAGSHGMRMVRFMLEWYKQGRLPIEPVIEAIDFFYSIQDPGTGLWGSDEAPRQARINGTFKLFKLLREQLDLPVPHADKLIDQVLAAFQSPDHERTVGGCDEWDNLYVLTLAKDWAERDREPELRDLAAWRLERIPALFGAPDGGFSFFPGRCKTDWIGFEMAPERPQGDAIGCCILSCAVNHCVELLDLAEASPWTGVWREDPLEPADIRRVIRDGLTSV